jgi:ornithine carbamoyltransferase
LKAAKYAGTETERLKGKEIALIFEKSSTRTRTSFEVAAYDQGGLVTYLGPSGSHIGEEETMKDTARVLGRIYDAIEYRGYAQEEAEILARYAGVPVYNGLTDQFHPTQILADFLTMQEHSYKPLEQITYCFLGDSGNNMGNSLLTGGAMMGMDVRLCGPRDNWPTEKVIDEAGSMAKEAGARVCLTENLDEGVKDCDFLYTDVWVSMGQSSDLWGERIRTMMPYQVTSDMMSRTGNPRTKFMHCLPSYHSTDTRLGKRMQARFGVDALEVTDVRAGHTHAGWR